LVFINFVKRFTLLQYHNLSYNKINLTKYPPKSPTGALAEAMKRKKDLGIDE